MQFTYVHSRSYAGLKTLAVTVKIHLIAGLLQGQLVGLGDSASASRQVCGRARSALMNSPFKWPDFRITVNLVPTRLPQSGTRFDLPIALGLIGAPGRLLTRSVDGRGFLASRNSMAASITCIARWRRQWRPVGPIASAASPHTIRRRLPVLPRAASSPLPTS